MRITRQQLKQIIKEEFRKWIEGPDQRHLAKRFNHEELAQVAEYIDDIEEIAQKASQSQASNELRDAGLFILGYLDTRLKVKGEVLGKGFYIVEDNQAFERRAIAGPFDSDNEAAQWAAEKLQDDSERYPGVSVGTSSEFAQRYPNLSEADDPERLKRLRQLDPADPSLPDPTKEKLRYGHLNPYEKFCLECAKETYNTALQVLPVFENVENSTVPREALDAVLSWISLAEQGKLDFGRSRMQEMWGHVKETERIMFAISDAADDTLDLSRETEEDHIEYKRSMKASVAARAAHCSTLAVYYARFIWRNEPNLSPTFSATVRCAIAAYQAQGADYSEAHKKSDEVLDRFRALANELGVELK